jgi:hypothetical protein
MEEFEHREVLLPARAEFADIQLLWPFQKINQMLSNFIVLFHLYYVRFQILNLILYFITVIMIYFYISKLISYKI